MKMKEIQRGYMKDEGVKDLILPLALRGQKQQEDENPRERK